MPYEIKDRFLRFVDGEDEQTTVRVPTDAWSAHARRPGQVLR